MSGKYQTMAEKSSKVSKVTTTFEGEFKYLFPELMRVAKAKGLSMPSYIRMITKAAIEKDLLKLN